MNILTEKLPDFVTVCDKNYPVYTDFRNWIKFEIIITNRFLSDKRKSLELLKLCYKQLPPAFDSALNAALDFYFGNSTTKGIRGGAPVYSFEHDADLIYAAFLSQYGIDLQTEYMHWWQFKALFKALDGTNKFVKIMQYRSADLSEIKNKDVKEFYRKMKQCCRLPDLRTEDEKDRDLICSLQNLF